LNQYVKWTNPPDEASPYMSYDADGNLRAEFEVVAGDSDCSTYVDFDDINHFVAPPGRPRGGLDL